jgi:hypothetical protein
MIQRPVNECTRTQLLGLDNIDCSTQASPDTPTLGQVILKLKVTSALDMIFALAVGALLDLCTLKTFLCIFATICSVLLHLRTAITIVALL